jgi:hypothetical protein
MVCEQRKKGLNSSCATVMILSTSLSSSSLIRNYFEKPGLLLTFLQKHLPHDFPILLLLYYLFDIMLIIVLNHFFHNAIVIISSNGRRHIFLPSYPYESIESTSSEELSEWSEYDVVSLPFGLANRIAMFTSWSSSEEASLLSPATTSPR